MAGLEGKCSHHTHTHTHIDNVRWIHVIASYRWVEIKKRT